MFKEIKDSMKGLVILIPLYTTIGAITIFILQMFRGVSCSDVEASTDIKTKFSIWSGCYVHVEGRWIPRDSWRIRVWRTRSDCGEYERKSDE